ncbi:unnamed protein product [Ilex paraguariensis]|uniref:RING-type domain-containing protein n=1 Tax=Ilex paraguariensis TaxID=185542 RepID=A0ABC8QW40_9AQUA
MAIQAQLHTENLGFPLGGSQDWMDNCCGFNELYFNPHQQQQKQQQMQHLPLQKLQPRNPNLYFDTSLLPKSNNNGPLMFSQSIASQIENQRQEIDRLISLQNERLRLAFEEHRNQQISMILKKYESKTQFLLRQKDEQIVKAMNRTIELEDLLQRMEIENQTWQRVAKENETMIISLNNTIEQLRENACLSTNNIEDAESCCDMIENNRGDTTENERGEGEDNTEHQHQQNNAAEQRTRKMICKRCNSRSSCIIFLPCRHLCSCKGCEAFLYSCPVCEIVKKATIEALI